MNNIGNKYHGIPEQECDSQKRLQDTRKLVQHELGLKKSHRHVSKRLENDLINDVTIILCWE